MCYVIQQPLLTTSLQEYLKHRNILNAFLHEYVLWSINTTRPINSINSFAWACSEQGHAYWNNLDTEFESNRHQQIGTTSWKTVTSH